MSVTGGQVMGDNFVLIVLSAATCSPPHQASGEGGGETRGGRVGRGPSLKRRTLAATQTSIKGGIELMARSWMIASCTGMVRVFGKTMSPTIA